jgi:hypothetical protein
MNLEIKEKEVYMRKVLIVGGLMLSLCGIAWGEDCVSEKKRIADLTQQNAQLSVNNAQLQFNAAAAEKTRLETLEKSGSSSPATPAPDALAPAPAATDAPPPAPPPAQ